MKRTIIALTTVVCLPLLTAQVAPMAFQPASWGGPSMPHIEGAQSGPVLARPISGTETRRTTQTLSDGTVVDHSEVSHFYRDSAGRMRAESPDRVEIFDPVSHMEYDLSPKKKTYRTFPISSSATSISVAVVGGTSVTSVSSDTPGSHRSSSAATEDLGRQMINGVMAKGSRVTNTVPAGAFGNNRDIKVVNERWYSEDLQLLVKSSNNDPRFGLNVYELTNIDQSAPSPSLFEPPSGYTLTSRDN
jgi:hypothetical protein